MPFSVQDRLDIIDLVANYALTIDASKMAEFLDNFAPDGVIVSGGTDYAGHARITEWMHNRMRRLGFDLDKPPPHSVRHFAGMPLVVGESDDKASASTSCVIFDQDANGNVFANLVATYFDEFEKKDGRWRFKRRVIHGDLDGR
jgi:hypothetical protein